MPDDDIYRSRQLYERFVESLPALVEKPIKGKRIYYCKNPANLEYFRKLITYFEVRDLSYIRRQRVLKELLLITHATEKDIKECTRDDVNEMVAWRRS